MEKEIPKEILNGFQEVATKYSRSSATTNAGRILRFVARLVPVSVLFKLIAHKIG